MTVASAIVRALVYWQVWQLETGSVLCWTALCDCFWGEFNRTTRGIAWENSRHFATPPMVSPRNDVWKTSAAIPYWWRVTDLGSSSDWSCRERNLFQPIRSTTQILVVTRHWRQQYGISEVVCCGFSEVISQGNQWGVLNCLVITRSLTAGNISADMGKF